MRIFQAIEGTSNAAVPGSQTWRRYLYEPLVEMGHDVFFFSITEGRMAAAQGNAERRARFSQHLLETFRAEHARRPFDLFFAYFMDGMVDPSVINAIGAAGVPTCNYSCNNTHQFHLVQEISPHFHYNLHSEKDAGAKFRAIGATPLWWPMAANPRYAKPVEVPRDVAVSFVGANYAIRARHSAHLLENGVDVHLYGPGWQWGSSSRWRGNAKRMKKWIEAGLSPSADARRRAAAELAEHDFRRNLASRFPRNVHGPVSDDDLIALYSRSQISLGFLEVHDAHNPLLPLRRHLHLREFEAPMSGALYCTGYMDELAEMFDIDREVVVYRNSYELLDKARYYLAHPAEADAIRNAGRERALRDHTYQRRFEWLFSELHLENRT